MTATAVREPSTPATGAAWLYSDLTARALADSVGRVIDTGWNIGVGRVVRLNPPSRKYPHGSVRVVNHLGEGDTFDFVRLRDRLRSGGAKFVGSLDDAGLEAALVAAGRHVRRVRAWARSRCRR